MCGCISIESNVWVGPNVVFESNTFIGHHSVVAANSLVQSGIYPPYSFIAGNPAKIKHSIKKQLDCIGKALHKNSMLV